MNKGFWDAGFYDEAHGFISRYGEDLLAWLCPSSGERICDAGCATGDLTYKVAKLGVSVIGVDSSVDMITQAKKKYENLHFEVADIKKLHFQNEFDAVFSNAVLHWIKDAEAAISSIYRSLKPGGRFVAELGGKSNIQTIIEGITLALDHFGFSDYKSRNPWVFFSVGEYSNLLEKEGFIVREIVYFDRLTELDKGEKGLRNWITMFADCFFQEIPIAKHEKMFAFIEEKVRSKLFKNGKWFADYKRLRFRAEKPCL